MFASVISRVYGERHSSSSSERVLNALELQTLSVPELSKSDNAGRVVSFLALEARSYRCPSLSS